MDKIIIEIGANTTSLNDASKSIDNLKSKEKQLGNEVKNTSKEFQKQGSDISHVIDSIGTKIAAAFAVSELISFGKAIIDTRAEFQKFEAQLTTALGSQSSAQMALQRIKQFAKETPFSVKEITETFVKLANRGITPTNEQLKKMGDLAAAMGKPMEQLNEAVLDINNPERWKELGVQVSTSGNKITGTFKGMTVTMDRTTEGALKMIEQFGGMEGVAGGMARQMDTLGGKMSNLDDATESLKNTLGETSDTIVSQVISSLTDMISVLDQSLATTNKIDKALKGTGKELGFFDKYFDTHFALLLKTQQELDKLTDKYTGFLDKTKIKTKEGQEAVANFKKEFSQGWEHTLDRLLKIGVSQEEIDRQYILFTATYKKFTEAERDAIKASNEEKQASAETNAERKAREAQIKKEIEALDGLKNKLRDLRIVEKELLAEELSDKDKNEELYRVKKMRIENEFKDAVDKADAEIKDKTRHDAAIVELERIKDQELINLQIKHDKDISDLKKKQTIDDIEYIKRMADMEVKVSENQMEDEDKIYEQKRLNAIAYYEDLIALEDDEKKKDELRLKEKLELDEIDKQHQDKKMAELKKNAAEIKKNDEEELKRREALTKKMVDSINEILQASLEAERVRIENEMRSNEIRITNEDKVIETQRILAQKGLKNDLAFEEKRRDDLAKAQLQQQAKLKKIKELEIFLNALAKFVEENPKTALSKAIGLIGATKAAETIFAEEGALVGSHQTLWSGQTHKSGRDRLAIVQDGEGIIPKHKMEEFGINTSEKFKTFIKTPFKEKLIPSRMTVVNNNQELIKKTEELIETVKNKKELNVDWVGLDLRLTEIEKGIKTATIIPRNRI